MRLALPSSVWFGFEALRFKSLVEGPGNSAATRVEAAKELHEDLLTDVNAAFGTRRALVPDLAYNTLAVGLDGDSLIAKVRSSHCCVKAPSEGDNILGVILA